MINKRAVTIFVALLLVSCGGGSGEGLDTTGRPVTGDNTGAPTPPSADFQFIQDTVLTPVCTVCHSGGAAPVGLRLDEANAFAMLVGISSVEVPELLRVAPGDPDNSYLVQKLEGTAAVGAQMPLGGPPVGSDTIGLIRQWILDGAQPPGQAEPPATPPTVVSNTPQADSVITAVPLSVSAVFSQAMDASFVSEMTFTLTGSGGDGSFSDGNEFLVTPLAVSLSNVQTASIDLDGVALSDDIYEARLIGTGATALADTGGLVLDGDADGVAGGDFTWRFTIDTAAGVPQATWRWIQDNVFTPGCTQCHVAGGIAEFLVLDEANSFAMTVDVPSIEVASLDRIEPGDPDLSYLVQKLEGTAAVGDQMPQGLPPLDANIVAAVRSWISMGVPLEPGDPMPDLSPPVVSLEVPASPLTGVVTLAATATDNSSVTVVRFYADDALLGTDDAAPYAIDWDTGAVANGNHTLRAEADDPEGNTGVSGDVIVSVDNPPPVDTTPPGISVNDPGSPLSGSVNLTLVASDDVGVTDVRLFIDDALAVTLNGEPYSFSWDTTAVSNGPHTLRAEADDAAGNTGSSSSITVTVDNGLPPDTEAPTIAIDPPAVPLSGAVNVTFTVADNVGVTAVRLFADDTLVGTNTAAPYSIAWDTTNLADGDHLLSAQAEDAAGNIGFSATLVVSVINGGPQATLAWIQDNVFTPVCTQCHIAGGIAEFLLLDDANSFGMLVNVPSTEVQTLDRVEPGQPDLSYLVQKLEGNAAVGAQMPLGGDPLSVGTIAVIRQWISDGANAMPGDTIAPVVTLDVPPSPLSGTVALMADATDNVGVTIVRFRAGGVVVGTDATAPYSADWDTSTVADGSYLVLAEAEDGSGNIGASQVVDVTVVNGVADTVPPVVTIQPVSEPASGTVTVAVIASDNTGVTDVELSVDGVALGTDTTAPFEFTWDTTALADGLHTLTATARDAAGNVGSSTPLSVTVDNSIPVDTTAPSVSIVSPADPVTGAVSITISAVDDVGVLAVRLFVDNTLVGTSAAAPYVVTWDSTTVSDGLHELRAEAEDAAGNIGNSNPVSVSVQNMAPAQATWRWVQDNIFTPQCTACHVQGGIADFLWLDEASSYSQLVNAPTTEGGPSFRVLPGDPDNSSLVQRLDGTLTPQMPLGGAPLSPDELAAVRQWILDGALPEEPADITPPAVTLVSPGATVSGAITLRAEASDDTGVSVVRFFVDGSQVASDATAPYEAGWDTTLVADGAHVVTAEADDAAGNVGVSMQLTVTVDNTLPPDATPPVVSIQPLDPTLSGVVSVAIDATDDVAVTSVSLLVDGIAVASDALAPFQVLWDTSSVANGDHTLVATAVDAAGNTGTSAAITVNVSNTGPVISLAIDAPANVLRGDEFPVTAIISNTGAASSSLTATLTVVPPDVLRIREPGAMQSVGSAPAMSDIPVDWIMRADEIGTATVSIQVSDAAGNIDVQQAVTITVTE